MAEHSICQPGRPAPQGDGQLGSPHAIDLGFVFGTNEFSEDSGEFFGSGEKATALVEHVQDAWLAFARTGDPRTDVLSAWQPYERSRRSTALFGDPVSVDDDPYGEERTVWDRVEAQLGGL